MANGTTVQNRLSQHADYLDRQGRQSLAAELRAAALAEEEVRMLHERLAEIADEARNGLEEYESSLRHRVRRIVTLARDVV